MKYLVRIDLARLEEIKRSLAALRASAEVKPVGQVLDYLVVDVPPELVPGISALGGVIAVTPERWLSIKQLLIPIDKKIDEFQRLFLANPITGPASAFKFSLEADMGKERVPTSESRKMLGADVADAEGITGKAIKVAVLDTGTNVLGVQGPYLGGRSTVEGMPIQADENGHGTHVQTTVSGRPFQSIHGLLKGVAVDADVAAFKVLGYGLGAGTNISVLRGMMDAFEWNADIISMSLGSAYTEEPPEVTPECRAIQMLTQQGIIIVVANGNDGPECLPGNTWLLTNHGFMTVSNAYRSCNAKDNKRKNIKLFNYNLRLSKFEEDEIVRIWRRKPKIAEKIYRITTEQGHIIEASETHPFLTKNGWEKAQELAEGDIILEYPETIDKYKVSDFLGSNNPIIYIGQEKREKVYRNRRQPVTERMLAALELGRNLTEEQRKRKSSKLKGQNNPRWCRRTLVICPECSAEFETHIRHDGSLGKGFCSRHCAAAYGGRNTKGSHHNEKTRKLLSLLAQKQFEQLSQREAASKRALKQGFGQIGAKALREWKKNNPELFIEASSRGAVTTRHNIYRPTKTEKVLRTIVNELGLSYEPEYPISFDHTHTIADVAIPSKKIALYADGDYWHSIENIKEKDNRINNELKQSGWKLLRFTETELINSPDECQEKIAELAINGAKVIKVEEKTRDIWLYDIETEKNHTIVANGLIVHNSHTVGVPANSPHALSVGAVSYPDGSIASFSSRGPTAQGLIKPDCTGPGVNILSTSAGLIATMQFMDGPPLLAAISGTSMSCPHVSGTVALALEYARLKGKQLTTQKIKEALELYGSPKNNETGWGLITYQILRRYIDEKL